MMVIGWFWADQLGCSELCGWMVVGGQLCGCRATNSVVVGRSAEWL